MKTLKQNIPLLLFPLVWVRFNLHSILALKANISDSNAWQVYDAGTYEIIVLCALYCLVTPNTWQRNVSLWLVGAYFTVSTILEWSGHNVKGDLMDNLLQAGCLLVIIPFLFYLSMTNEEERE